MDFQRMLDFTQTRLSSSRPLADYSKVQILISSLIRGRRAFARKPADGAYLNVGCGPQIRSNFCNLDYAWRPERRRGSRGNALCLAEKTPLF